MITNTHPVDLGRVGAALPAKNAPPKHETAQRSATQSSNDRNDTSVTNGDTTPQRSDETSANEAALEPVYVPWKRAYESVLSSSIMEEPPCVRLVFHYMILVADTRGFCIGTEETLSRRFNIPLNDFREAIEILVAPDSKSRSPENEGRRIQRVRGGWLILRHEHYQPRLGRKDKDGEEKRERYRDRDIDRDIDKETLGGRATYEKPPTPPPNTPPNALPNRSWGVGILLNWLNIST